MTRWRRQRAVLSLALLTWLPACVFADTLTIAVASNFRATLESLIDASDLPAARISSAASGVLLAQIEAGAPYDLFLSADSERPARLEQGGKAVTGTRRTYAIGRLVFWSPDSAAGRNALQAYHGVFSIANPDTAPYGRAALEVINALGIQGQLKLVKGNSISQAHQFIATGNASAGITAWSLSQSLLPPDGAGTLPGSAGYQGSAWLVPKRYHHAIEQQMILIRDTPDARQWHTFLLSQSAARVIGAAGYDTPESRDD